MKARRKLRRFEPHLSPALGACNVIHHEEHSFLGFSAVHSIDMTLRHAIVGDYGGISMCEHASRLRGDESSLTRQIAELFSEPDICFASTFYPSC